MRGIISADGTERERRGERKERGEEKGEKWGGGTDSACRMLGWVGL